MPEYNPHDTLTLEFGEAERALGAWQASRLFDMIRLERSLQRMQALVVQIEAEEHSGAVGQLLETLREFNELSTLIDALTKTAFLLEELSAPSEACIACALTAGGVCEAHAAGASHA